MDAATVSLIGSGLLFLGTLLNLYVTRRQRSSAAKNTDVEAFAKFQEMLNKFQDRNSELSNKMIALEKAAAEQERTEEKLRNDLASALVENVDLKTELAKKDGYIQGITDPLIKLEEAQKAALRGGRRATDVSP